MIVPNNILTPGRGTSPVVVRQTRLARSLYQNESCSDGTCTEWIFNFGNELIFGHIDNIIYSLELDPGYNSPCPHAAYKLNGTALRVRANCRVAGTVHMQVAECTGQRSMTL